MKLDSKITVEEYIVSVNLWDRDLAFIVRYIKHNGFTTIKRYIRPGEVNEFESFDEFLELNSQFTIRWEKPYFYTRIRFRRKQKLLKWAQNTIQLAINEQLTQKTQQLKY